MDDIDHTIIEILKKDCRTPKNEISKKVDITPKSVNTRICRMESEGIILKHTITLSEKYKPLRMAYVYPTRHPIKHVLPSAQEDIVKGIAGEIGEHPDVELVARVEENLLVVWRGNDFDPHKIKMVSKVEEKKIEEAR